MSPSFITEPTRALTISLTVLFSSFSAPPEQGHLPAPLLASFSLCASRVSLLSPSILRCPSLYFTVLHVFFLKSFSFLLFYPLSLVICLLYTFSLLLSCTLFYVLPIFHTLFHSRTLFYSRTLLSCRCRVVALPSGTPCHPSLSFAQGCANGGSLGTGGLSASNSASVAGVGVVGTTGTRSPTAVSPRSRDLQTSPLRGGTMG